MSENREKRMSDGYICTFYGGLYSYEISPGVIVRPGEFILSSETTGWVEVMDRDRLIKRYGEEIESWKP